tara:strand:+ start:182 stop:859 length:678 start_codon:yes stop_codon:yes gene_type:complete
MARLNIDTGTEGNSATGDTLRTAFTKVNTNFEDVYQLVGDPSTGLLTTSLTNGDVKVQPNGTGVVEIDQLQINNTTISSITTNGDITIEPNGTGDILLKPGGQVGIGDVSSPDTSLHIKQANAILTLQRTTSDANTPGINFQSIGGNVRAKIFMDGTDGTNKEIVFQNQDGSMAEKFRVTLSGAKVTGHFAATGAQIDFTALPTSDPAVAGRLWRSGNDVKISTG